MTIKLTIQEILNYDSVVKNIIDNTSVDGILKFRFLQMAKQFESTVENVNKVRDELIDKYSEVNENGQSGIFQPRRDQFVSDEDYNAAVKKFDDTIAKFNKDMKKVLDDTVELEITKFKASDIMNAGIPSDALLVLYNLIEE